MSTLQPRGVPPGSWWAWLREGVNLATQRIALRIPTCLILFEFGAVVPPPLHKLFMMLMAPVYLGVFVIFAENADKGGSLPLQLKNAWGGLVRLGMLSFAVEGFVIGASYLLDWSNLMRVVVHRTDFGADAETQHHFSVIFTAGAETSICLAIWLGGAFVAWFGTAVFAIAHAPFKEGCVLAVEAYIKNQFILALGLIMSGVSLALTIFLQGFACVMLYPIVGAMLYVSYRDVFLGIPPRKAVQTATAGKHLPTAV